MLETENTKLKEANKTFSKEVQSLKQRVKYIEAENLSVGPRVCKKCDYQTEDGYVLDSHFWSEYDVDRSLFLILKACDASFPSLII